MPDRPAAEVVSRVTGAGLRGTGFEEPCSSTLGALQMDANFTPRDLTSWKRDVADLVGVSDAGVAR